MTRRIFFEIEKAIIRELPESIDIDELLGEDLVADYCPSLHDDEKIVGMWIEDEEKNILTDFDWS